MRTETKVEGGTLIEETRPSGDGDGAAHTIQFVPDEPSPDVSAARAVIEAAQDPEQKTPRLEARVSAIETLLLNGERP